MIYSFFSHAGELHASQTEASSHYLQDWYVAIPLLLAITVTLGWVIYLATKKSKPVTYLSITSLLLIIGVSTYTLSPLMSITALSIGMALLLVTILASLMRKTNQNTTKKSSS